MKGKLAAVLGFVLLVGVSAPATAADTVVLRVVVVETADLNGYVKELEKGKAILKRLESPVILRVWHARFAGPQAGSVVVSQEWPSMAAFAKDDAKTSADAEFQTFVNGLSKIRKIVSDSLYTEVKP